MSKKQRGKRERNYYKSHDGISSSRYKMFLVRYVDIQETSAYDGPFASMDEALDKVSEYLRKGTCAWVIGYNE